VSEGKVVFGFSEPGVDLRLATLEKAAERLGIGPTTLWRKRYGIEIETFLKPQPRG
jgi:Bacterial regulatory protein, Fis family